MNHLNIYNKYFFEPSDKQYMLCTLHYNGTQSILTLFINLLCFHWQAAGLTWIRMIGWPLMKVRFGELPIGLLLFTNYNRLSFFHCSSQLLQLIQCESFYIFHITYSSLCVLSPGNCCAHPGVRVTLSGKSLLFIILTFCCYETVPTISSVKAFKYLTEDGWKQTCTVCQQVWAWVSAHLIG